jgi:hypothetical protein
LKYFESYEHSPLGRYPSRRPMALVWDGEVWRWATHPEISVMIRAEMITRAVETVKVEQRNTFGWTNNITYYKQYVWRAE